MGVMKQDRVALCGIFELNSVYCSAIVVSALSCSKLKVNGSLQWTNLYPVDSIKKNAWFPQYSSAE